MRQALLDTKLLSSLCKRIGLQYRVQSSPSERQPDNQVLSIMFEAYIGGLYDDLGPSRYEILRGWFAFLIKPYAMQCKSNYDHFRSQSDYGGSHRGSTPSHRSPETFHRGRTYSAGLPLDDPSLIHRPGTSAP